MKKTLLSLLIILFSCNAYAETKVVHTIVALCDNIHQRIYPVPYKLGKGNDPENNLYWGAMYGIKTYFKNSKDWLLVEETKDISKNILRRAVFKHKNSDTWMVADAYLGKRIDSAIANFLSYSSGSGSQTIEVEYNGKKHPLGIGGKADLINYIGHNGLMDFSISQTYKQQSNSPKEVIILACYSKNYFSDLLNETGAKPILWTNGKLAPEAYILKSALDSWIAEEGNKKIREKAAFSYAKYQKISEKAALNLFSSN